MTQKIKTGFFSLTNLARIGSAATVTWLLNACGFGLHAGDKATPLAPSTSSGTPQLSVTYIDSTNSGTAVPLNSVSAFPGIGLFNLMTTNCPAVNQYVDYTFAITNTGTGPLTSTSGSPVSAILLNTNPASLGTNVIAETSGNPYGDNASYTFTVTQQPTFPIAAGKSSQFTVRFNYNADGNNPGGTINPPIGAPFNALCTFAWIDYQDPYTWALANSQTPPAEGIVQFQLAIQTNDPVQGNYSADLSVWGQS